MKIELLGSRAKPPRDISDIMWPMWFGTAGFLFPFSWFITTSNFYDKANLDKDLEKGMLTGVVGVVGGLFVKGSGKNRAC